MSEGCICSKCSELRPNDQFYKHSTGFQMAHCKSCHLEMGRAYRKKLSTQYVSPKTEEARQKRLAASRAWREANKAYDAARAQAYRVRKLHQMPPWADAEAIFQFYDNCPEGHHVDHIVPLKGQMVRGLHVIDNLQYLPAKDNIRKGNRYVSGW